MVVNFCLFTQEIQNLPDLPFARQSKDKAQKTSGGEKGVGAGMEIGLEREESGNQIKGGVNFSSWAAWRMYLDSSLRT